MRQDPFALSRFLDAQDPVFDDVRRELRSGRKEGHWMWFVFPQLKEFGRSSTATYYGIGSAAEAKAYVNHPVLGARLVEATQLFLPMQATICAASSAIRTTSNSGRA